MYEVVLMMALSQGAATPAWEGTEGPPVKIYADHGHREYRHRRWGCHGGGGCWGSNYGYGGCSGSGYGYGGCSGGGYGYGGGCYGSGYGYGGCSGSGYGCYGSGGYGSGYGCWGSGYSPYNMYPMPAMQPGTRSMQQPGSGSPNIPAPKPKTSGSGEANLGLEPATFVVTLPPEATLTVDGAPTRSASSTRSFVTPPLRAGEEFFYDLKATLNRDGQSITASQRVAVRAGQESRVRLEFPQTAGAGG